MRKTKDAIFRKQCPFNTNYAVFLLLNNKISNCVCTQTEISTYLCIGFEKAIDCLTLKSKRKMKKLVFMFAAVVAMSFASCGNNSNEAAAADSDTVVVEDTVVADTCAADTAAADSVVAE